MMTFDEWLKIGQDQGFCSREFCLTHDKPPMSQAEYDNSQYDFCVQSVRLGTPENWEGEIIKNVKHEMKWDHGERARAFLQEINPDPTHAERDQAFFEEAVRDRVLSNVSEAMSRGWWAQATKEPESE